MAKTMGISETLGLACHSSLTLDMTFKHTLSPLCGMNSLLGQKLENLIASIELRGRRQL